MDKTITTYKVPKYWLRDLPVRRPRAALDGTAAGALGCTPKQAIIYFLSKKIYFHLTLEWHKMPPPQYIHN